MKNKKARIARHVALYDGYLQLDRYDLEVPGLDSDHRIRTLTNQEMVHSPDSVLVLIYAADVDSFVLGREFRTGVFCNQNHHDDPVILECVSGTIETNETPQDAAKREVYEEAGLKIDCLQTIAQIYKSPGILTEKAYIFYTRVAGSPQSGLYGIDTEEIVTQIEKREKVYELMDAMNIIDSASLLALNWFRAHEKSLTN
ncbi:NUDIX domain-containing protein [Legionella spiritensis]|uniref:ADP-ribose pyrophosphatase n=1 Tax=Legionella spiritensis TaxID=452 RepID=A0A0W0Z4Q7_LEGSP|nr:NUDIX hydrolase [Legionella spiritensis]KTD64123.1 ADP-ribose pyrophosphatase [Legionella spiritensis]SNV37945.1 ADP-ribose pyrophosphatase [Legionella spiritensis]